MNQYNKETIRMVKAIILAGLTILIPIAFYLLVRLGDKIDQYFETILK